MVRWTVLLCSVYYKLEKFSVSAPLKDRTSLRGGGGGGGGSGSQHIAMLPVQVKV